MDVLKLLLPTLAPALWITYELIRRRDKRNGGDGDGL
jgi:hypothetical protein